MDQVSAESVEPRALALSGLAVEVVGSGEPGLLRISGRPVPGPGPDEVLIAVEAAGVNRHDVNQRRRGPSSGHSNILGLEVSGRVVALGPGVTGHTVGDAVAALTDGGGYAEHAVAKASCAFKIPDGLSFVEAAALPEALFTVWHNFFGIADLGPGEAVLIHGGASGIGTIAIQLLTALGHPVLATCGSPEKISAARDLGAVAVFDYRSGDLAAQVIAATGGRGVDVVLDMSGGRHTAASLAALTEGGHIVHLSPGAGAEFSAPLRDIMAKEARITGSLLRPLPERDKAAIADRLRAVAWPLVASGRVRPVIHAVLPLDAVAEALDLMEEGRHIGKIVLVPQGARAPEAATPRAARAAWVAALISRDVGALEDLVDEDLSYVHSTGRADDRTSWLDHVRAGPDFLALEFRDASARLTGETAVLSGDLRLALRRAPTEEPVTLDVHSIQVWRRVAGRWRLSAAQTTRRA